MKNKVKWQAIRKIAGIVALVALIGFSMAACELGNGPGGGGNNGGANLSLNGTWVWEATGIRVTISGSTGVINTLPSTASPLWTDAINKGYVSVGSTYYRNLTSTGTYTWSGQVLTVQYYNSSPNVAIGTSWNNCTITLSSNGQTFSDGYTWIRR